MLGASLNHIVYVAKGVHQESGIEDFFAYEIFEQLAHEKGGRE